MSFFAVERDTASAEFFDAAGRGSLLIQRCAACGAAAGPDVRTCAGCGGTRWSPTVASGRGTLVSWAVVHQPPLPALAAAVPYLTAVVELAEGPWLFTRLVDADPESLAAGDPVEVRFVVTGGTDAPGESLPVFAPA